jgi:phospholipid/cholesterol/gamma-HCH transport system ATP-binding protein
MIKIRNLQKSFGTKQVLKGVDLDIKEGLTTVIFGLSGGGKSTIIKHIVGLLKADAGSIDFNGVDIVKLDDKEIFKVRSEIGYLFQSGALFDSMNIFENIAFPLRERFVLSESEITKRVNESLEMVALDPSRVGTLFPDELSGGMRKRAGLARTIIAKPRVMLYDEPTTGLDPITSDEISKMIVHLQNELKTTSILISHDIKEAFKCGDEFAMLYDGVIIEQSKSEEFKHTTNPVTRQFLDGLAEGPINLL